MVQTAAALSQGHANLSQGFQVSDQFAVGAAGAFGHRAKLSTVFGEKCDQKIGFTEGNMLEDQGLAMVRPWWSHG